MQNFQINQVNPSKYKREIITLWKNNLPHTPEGRFEWMADNPEGASIWYLAIDEKSLKVIGSISILPRRIRMDGKTYLAGIVGDFMVEKKFRVFGPTFGLLNTVTREYSKLGFDFLYSFPNQASEKVVLRAGFKIIGLAKRLVKPLNLKNKLIQYIPSRLATIFSLALNFALELLSKETYMKANISFNQINEPNLECDLFWRKIKDRFSTIGERSADYLKWRYFKNPLYRFSMFTYSKTLDNTFLGYIIFNVQNNNVHIFDILPEKEKFVNLIIGRFIKEMRNLNYSSLSIGVLRNNPLYSYIKYFGFVDSHEDVPVLYAGDSKLIPQNWVFFSGDRNV